MFILIEVSLPVFEQFFTPYHPSCAIVGRKVLILAPHPDDEIFGCGACASKWAQQGADIKVLILTDGVIKNEFADQPNAEQLRAEKAALRANESRLAATILGLPEPEFLHGQDGVLSADAAMQERLLRLCEEWQPSTIVMPSIWEMHRDHRATAELGLSIAQLCSTIEQVAMYEVGVPLMANVLEDISATAALKWQAMQCFASQLVGQRYAEQIQGLNRFRSYTLGLEVEASEAFHCLSRADLETFIRNQQPAAASYALHQAEQSQHRNQHEIALRQQRIEALEQQLQATQRTLSWRITKPLRWLKRRLG